MQTEPTTSDRNATPSPLPAARERGDSAPQTTMRVTKRNGADRAGRSQQDRARGQPLLQRACPTSTRCASRPRRSAGSTTARPRASSIGCRSRPRRRSIAEEPQYGRLAARLLATYIDKEVAQPGDPRVHRSRSRPAHRLGLVNARLAAMVATQRAQAQRRDRRPSAIASSSTSACARSTTATCCATPRRAS